MDGKDFKSSLGMGKQPSPQSGGSSPVPSRFSSLNNSSSDTFRTSTGIPRGSDGLMRGSDGLMRGSDGITKSPTLSSQNDGSLNEVEIMRTLDRIPEMYHKTSFEARKAALDFMRSSVRTEQLTQVEDWLDKLNDVTDDIVDVYFQGFNKSIHNYSRILQYMGNSHSNALEMSKEVEEVNKLIYFNNSNIDRMWRRNLEYYYMIKILEKMEELKKVPDLLEKYVKGNHFVHASNLVVNALNTLNERDLVNVNALMDLRQSLSERKEQFNEIIVDKLNDHVYLKSLKGDDDEEDLFDFKSNLKKALSLNSPPSNSSTTTTTNKLNQMKLNGASKDEDEEPLELELISKQSNNLEDLNINPESNGKLFMNLLVESLNVLDYLESAVGLMLGKISIELKSIINSCSNSVTLLYQSEGRVIPKIPGESSGGSGNIALGNSSNGIDLHDHSFSLLLGDNIHGAKNDHMSNIPLKDLMKAIFKRVMMVFKNHMTLAQIVNESLRKKEAKKKRHTYFTGEDGSANLTNSMEEGGGDESSSGSLTHSSQQIDDSDIYSISLVWEIIQKEIREMLRIHLHDTSSLALRTNTLNQNEPSKNNNTSRLFSFSNSIVTETWNGSASPSLTSPSISVGNPLGSSGGISASVSIFKSSQYNVTPIYPIIVKFTDQIDSIISKKMDKDVVRKAGGLHLDSSKDDGTPKGLLRLYIDDFVHRNFLQHIKNDYKDRVTTAIEGPEAFKPLERYKLVFKLRETKPILNSTLQIYQFITELYSDIVAMSHYVEEFGAIIQTTLLRYKEKCLSKFNQELDPTLTGTLLNDAELYKHLQNAYDHKGKQETPKFQETREEEYEYKLESDLFTNPEKPVLKNQLILDLEKMTMLANLNYSLEWLADRVSNLFWPQTNVTGQNTMGNSTDSTPIQKGKTPIKSHKASNQQKNVLPPEILDSLISIEFIVKDFRDLAKKCLIALRVEYRIHCIYYLEGFKKTSFVCEEERNDADPFITELNKDLSSNEESMTTYLSNDKCQFLFGGVAKLIGKLFIHHLSHIKQINNNGVGKLCKNVFTLQQNLTNIIVKREIFFDRIRQFYQSLGAEDELMTYLLEKMTSTNFSMDEARTILDFLTVTKRISANALQTLEGKFKLM